MLPLRLPRPVLASALSVTVLSNRSEKLSIYDNPSPPVILLETPSPLETKIGVVRQAVTGAYRDTHASVQGVVNRWIGVEHAIESRVKSIMSPSEHLTPGILYVGIATLTGSVLSRTRSLPTRIILPPAFFFISLHHFLPQTTSNLTAYLSSLERAYIPAVAERHAVLNSWLKSGLEGARNGVERGRKEAMSTAEGLVRGVQNATGLKLREVFGSAQSEESLKKRDETKG